MGKVFLLAMLAGALAFGALCAPALAQSDSAVDEYQENVPGAGGGPSSNEGGQGGGGAGGGGGSESGGSAGGGAGASLAPATADELSEQGSAGSGLSEFTERTGTAPASSQGSAGGQGSGGAQGSGGGSGGGSDASAGSTSTSSSDDEGFLGGLGDVLSTLLLGTDSGSDSGGLGLLFPILLIAALLGTVAFLVLHRRRGDAEQHQG